MLAPLDWAVIAAYLLFALLVGFVVREVAGRGRRSYFIADRSLPWWWAGTSIAATTFAADTPLAITGIVAARGVSGNWLWLSWVLVHAAVVAVFAARWWRADVVTDAEFIALRYGGRAAAALRAFRAGLYGLVFNAIVLGWVLRAMGKIVHPLVPWDTWAPGLVARVATILPADAALGGPSELLTIGVLVLLVACYSSLGGIRGVIVTDLVQFALGLAGSVALAWIAWSRTGGDAAIRDGLAAHATAAGLGDSARVMTRLFPSLTGGWPATLGIGAFGFGAYLLVQAYANVPADGGGYLQQRLSSTRSASDARKAAGLFLLLQYGLRVWPWLVTALAAVVLLPVGGEIAVLGPELGAAVAADRELAYPALMTWLLPPGLLGLLVVSLLAAFMSTIDTHFNWGASYVVSDLAPRLVPDLSERAQVRLARASVVAFAVLAVLVAIRIDRIEQAWRWVAALGAALGVPTVLRWLWWRVTAAAEFAGAAAGLVAAAVLLASEALPYELQLVATSAVSALAMLLTIVVRPAPDAERAEAFAVRVGAVGVWPGRDRRAEVAGLARAGGATVGIAAAAIGTLWLGLQLLGLDP